MTLASNASERVVAPLLIAHGKGARRALELPLLTSEATSSSRVRSKQFGKTDFKPAPRGFATVITRLSEVAGRQNDNQIQEIKYPST